MGRYDFRPQRVLRTADQLLETKRITQKPPWYRIIQDIPPSAFLTRPVFQDSSHQPARRLAKKGLRSSKAFQPLPLQYEEDALRTDFFGDHPWELARPKVVVEDSGDQAKGWDWGKGIKQLGKRLDGESVIQRQLHLMKANRLAKQQAYDIARKEYYYHRHIEAVEQRTAREEALATGAHFGKGTLEISMALEDAQFEDWKEWALKQVEVERQKAGAAYSGNIEEETRVEESPGLLEEEPVEGEEVAPPALGQESEKRGTVGVPP